MWAGREERGLQRSPLHTQADYWDGTGIEVLGTVLLKEELNGADELVRNL